MLIVKKILATFCVYTLLIILSPSLAESKSKPLPLITAASTQGPEGSEFGQGGYEDSFNRFYVGADFGSATFKESYSLIFGAHFGFMYDDWAAFELNGLYLPEYNKSYSILIGPRLRSVYEPVAFSFTLKAGSYTNHKSYFMVSPGLGADFLVTDNFSTGLEIRHDYIIGTSDINNIFMKLEFLF